jgi:hypothetical protein
MLNTVSGISNTSLDAGMSVTTSSITPVLLFKVTISALTEDISRMKIGFVVYYCHFILNY